VAAVLAVIYRKLSATDLFQPQKSSIVGDAKNKKQREDSDTGFFGERVRRFACGLATWLRKLKILVEILHFAKLAYI
jgi:hypothetical protein